MQWIAFGGEQVIATNDRAAQRKIIKYNHLVANCLIFYNVVVMSKALQEVQAAGHVIDSDAVAALSPYITEHIDRFGRYSLDVDQQPPPLDASLYSAAWLPHKGRPVADEQRSLHGEQTEGTVQLAIDGW